MEDMPFEGSGGMKINEEEAKTYTEAIISCTRLAAIGLTEWTNAFLDALATNKTRLTNRQSRRKIKEVLDKLGYIPRAHMISFNVDECL